MLFRSLLVNPAIGSTVYRAARWSIEDCAHLLDERGLIQPQLVRKPVANHLLAKRRIAAPAVRVSRFVDGEPLEGEIHIVIVNAEHRANKAATCGILSALIIERQNYYRSVDYKLRFCKSICNESLIRLQPCQQSSRG